MCIADRAFYGALRLGLVGLWALLAPPPSEDTPGQIVALTRLDSRVVVSVTECSRLAW